MSSFTMVDGGFPADGAVVHPENHKPEGPDPHTSDLWAPAEEEELLLAPTAVGGRGLGGAQWKTAFIFIYSFCLWQS